MGVNVPVEAFSGMILLVRCALSLRIDTAGAMTKLTAQSWSHVISTYAFTRQYVLLSYHFEQHLLIIPVSTLFRVPFALQESRSASNHGFMLYRSDCLHVHLRKIWCHHDPLVSSWAD